jgi:hypothetical protein
MSTRDISCRAIAHVHDDKEKMTMFEERLGRPQERYFGDEAVATAWLLPQ